MRRSWSIATFEHEQPVTKVWKAVTRSIRALDATQRGLFSSPVPTMWFAGPLDDEARAALDPLLQRLAALGAKVHATPRWVIEPADHERADFVGIFGTDLGPGFIAGADDALTEGAPCPSCPGHDPVLRAPLVIDEDRLDRPSADGVRPGPGGWDVVQLVGFFVGVSARFADLLRQQRVEGVELAPMLSRRSGRPSTRLFLLEPSHRVLAVCPDHTASEDGTPPASLFCPSCGRGVAGALRGMRHVRADAVGDAAVVSNHPVRGALPYLRRGVDDAIRAAGLDGVVRHDAFMLCAHQPPR